MRNPPAPKVTEPPSPASTIPRREKILLIAGTAALLCAALLLLRALPAGWELITGKLSEVWKELTTGGGSLFTGP
ncbi:MAG: hypothetical protein MUC42_14935 [Bryobacter sp.]|nr:hypothetical protein [Bryobacter sp.]